jgi:hypothetical protein
MDKDLNTDAAHETSRLLAELGEALDQCGVMRDIVDKYERLHSIENIAGSSSKTRVLREEIESMERDLRFERYQQRLQIIHRYSSP